VTCSRSASAGGARRRGTSSGGSPATGSRSGRTRPRPRRAPRRPRRRVRDARRPRLPARVLASRPPARLASLSARGHLSRSARGPSQGAGSGPEAQRLPLRCPSGRVCWAAPRSAADPGVAARGEIGSLSQFSQGGGAERTPPANDRVGEPRPSGRVRWRAQIGLCEGALVGAGGWESRAECDA